MAKKKTHEEYVEELAIKNPNINVIGMYINGDTKILHKCKKENCQYEWLAAPHRILCGTGCPKCAGNIKITHEMYVSRVKKINNNIEVIGSYIDKNTKIMHKCLIDGYEWMARPRNILIGHGCPQCALSKQIKRQVKSHEQYLCEVKNIDENIDVVDEYINNATKIKHICKMCNYVWCVTPTAVLKSNGCPVCHGTQTIGPPPKYKNSIWHSEHKEYFSQYLTDEQMKSYTPNSGRKVYAHCPNCNKNKLIRVSSLLSQGLGCVCGDGFSYPNKFIINFLDQLKVNYISEYHDDWTNNKSYDIYIPELQCVIENHGMQHYDDINKQKENDDYKQRLAIENGVCHYVVLDCRKSNKQWIRNSIKNSVLPSILNFDVNKIDWDLCDKYATTNLVKIASELWNNGCTTNEIANEMNMHISTVISYLKRANEFGWCDYVPWKKPSLPNKTIKKVIECQSEYLIRN